MLEKLKDFFYDCSDTLLSLLIILVIASVIVWKLSGVMNIPILNDIHNSDEIIKAEKSTDIAEKVPKDSNIPKEDISQETISDSTNVSQSNASDNNAISSEENTNQEAVIEEPTEANNNDIEVIKVAAQDIKIEIPKGSTGSSIARILEENGLIENTSQFINRVEDLELSPKLRFGTFTIKSNSSLDEIIFIITGTK